MAKEVKFDIGGSKYKVSRTLLDMHPDTMLARSASKQWQQDPESEIYIERDGTRFRFVLDYLRDDKVTLPVTESKESFIADLAYYGVEVHPDKIDDTKSKLFISKTAIKKVLKDLQVNAVVDEVGFRTKTLASFCIEEYFKCGVQKSEAKIRLSESHEARKNLKALLRVANADLIMERTNACIKCVGIKVTKINHNDYYLVVKEVGKKSKRNEPSTEMDVPLANVSNVIEQLRTQLVEFERRRREIELPK